MPPSIASGRLRGAPVLAQPRRARRHAEQFREYLHREFPEQASQWNDPKGRREFLKLMSASLALAGVSACVEAAARKDRPVRPAARRPGPGPAAVLRDRDPVCRHRHARAGRKPRGSSDQSRRQSTTSGQPWRHRHLHPGVDPDPVRPGSRCRRSCFRGEVRGWGDFLIGDQERPRRPEGQAGRGPPVPDRNAHLADASAEQIGAHPAGVPAGEVAPVGSGHARRRARRGEAGRRPCVDAIYHFDKADVVVTLDADFLRAAASSVDQLRARFRRRGAAPAIDAEHERRREPRAVMNRLYAIESTPTLTGAKADHRLALKASEIAAAAQRAVGRRGRVVLERQRRAKFLAAVAKDLQAHRGRSLVVAGEYQPAAGAHARAPDEPGARQRRRRR